MHDINLLPDKILYRKKRALTLVLRIFAGLIALCILTALLLFKTYSRLELQYRVFVLNNQINQSSLKDLNAAQERLAAKQEEFEGVKKLYSVVPTGEIMVNKLVEKAAMLMPPSVFAEDIEYIGQDQILKLKVTAQDKNDLVLFLKRLYNDPAFTDINISKIESLEQEFKATVTIKVGQEKTEKDK